MMDTADPRRVMMASSPMLDITRTAFAGLAGYSQPIEVVGGAGELSTFVDHGYTRAFAGLGVHRWCHVPGDDLDKVSADLLLPVLAAHRMAVELAVAEMMA
jgi:hypothetical protein